MGRRHWEHDAVRLGEDAHGTWLGVRTGTAMTRPGVAFRTHVPQVELVPADAGFVASFYAPGGDTPHVYVDITTVPCWAGGTVAMVDLDLDVIRGWTGRVWVDDEDEFAEHRVSLGYPASVVREASATCDAVLAAVRAGEPPYDGPASARWFAALAELS